MGNPPINSLTVSGGAAKNNLMNKMKASLFNCPVYVPEETDSSAYGAMILASVGSRDFNEELCDTVNKLCKKRLSALPDEALGERLRDRFEIYKSLYPALKEQFSKLYNITFNKFSRIIRKEANI